MDENNPAAASVLLGLAMVMSVLDIPIRVIVGFMFIGIGFYLRYGL